MTDAQQREAARQFYYRWKCKGKEDEHARSYWIELLHDVLGVEDVTQRVEFEKKLIGSKGSTERIDVYIPETRVIIEQKSLGIALDRPQAGHDGKTPYEQAKGYDNYLPFSERARWIVLSNFEEIWIYDLDARKPEPVKLLLSELQDKYHLLRFLVAKEADRVSEEVELSKAAGELVGKIRDRFLAQYTDPLAKRTQKSLNILCVRLVFCLFAEDAGLFGERDAFSRYVLQYRPGDIRGKLIELFKVLDTPVSDRADLYLDDEAAAFPYVNGGLFSDENIVVPKITQELKDTIAEAARFDWAKISPTIFGAVFESTLNPETRRKGGMHYTSLSSIHKLIDPLFLDDLRQELEGIKEIAVPRTQKRRLREYQEKLAGLVFLDPACGSGNFLTESYLCLRRLENEALKLIVAADSKTMTGQIAFGFDEESPIHVSIHQFYGIEINDFAAAVAKTALWIAESQMLRETEDIIHQEMDFFPLKDYAGITEGNALRLDWGEAAPVDRLSYIIGNPPFVGARLMSAEQKWDVEHVFGEDWKSAGNLDYVCCWYKKAADLMTGTSIRTALVSTNSVCQGETVAALWGPLFADGVHIDFAYRTFVWNSEAADIAHVHCVIVAFSKAPNTRQRVIYDDSSAMPAENINGYLVDAVNTFAKSRKRPICDVPAVVYGSMPNDGGHLSNYTDEDMAAIIRDYPSSEKMFRRFLGATEFINRRRRWCLWLVDVPPEDIKKVKPVMDAVQAVKEMRGSSSRASTRKLAETPTLFGEIRQPATSYIIIPRHSSAARRYIPMGFVSPDIICGDSNLLLPDASLYHFGILSSNVHNSWMRTVCGRIKSDYRYSVNVVYNNFPWPSPTSEQRRRIEHAAQSILAARALYPDSSLAALYDPLTMPKELRRAHKRTDMEVMEAYGMPIRTTDEAACVAWLMRLYQEITQGNT